MGSIGPLEVLVVLVVALVVLGPNRLPDAARSVGKAMAELRRMTSGFQAEVRDAFSEPPPPRRPAAAAEPVALPTRPEQADRTATVAAPVTPDAPAGSDAVPAEPLAAAAEAPGPPEPRPGTGAGIPEAAGPDPTD